MSRAPRRIKAVVQEPPQVIPEIEGEEQAAPESPAVVHEPKVVDGNVGIYIPPPPAFPPMELKPVRSYTDENNVGRMVLITGSGKAKRKKDNVVSKTMFVNSTNGTIERFYYGSHEQALELCCALREGDCNFSYHYGQYILSNVWLEKLLGVAMCYLPRGTWHLLEAKMGNPPVTHGYPTLQAAEKAKMKLERL